MHVTPFVTVVTVDKTLLNVGGTSTPKLLNLDVAIVLCEPSNVKVLLLLLTLVDLHSPSSLVHDTVCLKLSTAPRYCAEPLIL